MEQQSKSILSGRNASLENILFNVEQVKLDEKNSLFPNLCFSSQYSSAIYCPSMAKVLHVAGSKYQLVSNEALVMPVHDKLVDLFGTAGFSVQCSNEDDRRFSVRFILNEHEIKVTNNDFLNVMIEVQNSYDGSLQHSMALSYYRQVCSNGMMAWKQDSKISQRHNSDFSVNLNKILGKLDSLDVQLNQFRTLTERKVTGKEIEEIVERMREFTHRDAFPKKILPEVPLKVYEEAEQLNTVPNAWLLYNGFNNFLNHDERIGSGMDVRERVDKNVLRIIREELSLN